jgi:hypothetical protein
MSKAWSAAFQRMVQHLRPVPVGLDDADREAVQAKRRAHNRLGYAVQLTSVRFLGRFMADPRQVPAEVAEYLAEQLEIADPSCLKEYGERDGPQSCRGDPAHRRTPLENTDRVTPFAVQTRRYGCTGTLRFSVAVRSAAAARCPAVTQCMVGGQGASA